MKKIKKVKKTKVNKKIIKPAKIKQIITSGEGRCCDFFATARECFFIITSDGKWVSFNDATVEILGYASKEELLKIPVDSIYANPEERAKIADFIKKQGYTKDFPVQLKRKNGTIIDTTITAGVWQNINNPDKEYFGIIRDITNQKKAEKELLQSEERFSKAFQTSPYAITITQPDKNGAFLDVNNSFTTLTGFTKEEALANSSIGLSLWANKEDWKKMAADLHAGIPVVNREYVFRMKNGELRTGLFSSQPLKLTQGFVLLSSIADITDRKKAEEALLESEKRFHDAFEVSQDGLLLIDKIKGVILNSNKSAQTLFGYSQEELLVKTPWDIGVLKSDADFKELVVTLEKDNIVRYRDMPLQTRKGLELSLDISLVNGPKIIQCNIRDITKEKEIEKLRTDFLTLAAHQLRTPLSGAKWLIETMNRGVVGEITKEQREYLDGINKVNEQMIKLVSDILNTLRLESGNIPVKHENILVSSISKDVLSLVIAAAKGKNIELQYPSDTKQLAIKTDAEMLKSILGSFLSNAIDYSSPGQKIIFDIKEDSEKVVFSVHDFGIGIPEVEKKRIFERFYRATNAKNVKPTGTGLGLNISRMLAGKIDADIRFESEENKGTTFYLSVPKGKK